MAKHNCVNLIGFHATQGINKAHFWASMADCGTMTLGLYLISCPFLSDVVPLLCFELNFAPPQCSFMKFMAWSQLTLDLLP